MTKPCRTWCRGLARPAMRPENQAPPIMPLMDSMKNQKNCVGARPSRSPKKAGADSTYRNMPLNGMPLVSSLHGLHNLETVSGQLVLGDCLNGGSNGGGMDGLVDLSGLDALTVVGGLGVANGVALVGLDGAPMLQAVTYLELVGNPKLEQAAVDELVAQFTMAPAALCFGDWSECECFGLMPP